MTALNYTHDKEPSDIREYFTKSRERVRSKHNRHKRKRRASIGISLATERARIVDEVIKKLYKSSGYGSVKDISVVALGGYGRNQLCPYSDIDLLFLYRQESHHVAKEVAEKILYFLWDLNLEVGHCVRTVDESLELSQGDDSTILTSLLDSRFITGEKRLYNNLHKRIFGELLPEISSSFISKKIEENENRLERFGRSVYLIEPNVKEGEGGLRDLHSALWIAQAKYKIKTFEELLKKGVISEKEHRVIQKCFNFLLLVRSELHYLAERREDRLSFDYQEKVARFFNYKDARLKAVEKFMRIYYLRASLVHEQSKRLIEKCISRPTIRLKERKTRHLDFGFIIQGGKLSVTSRNVFKENPVNLVRAFELSDRHEVEMSRYLVWLIRENVTQINDKVRKDKEFNEVFLRILRSGKRVTKQLLLMNELRLLGHYIPEFGKIVCLVQHDAYHVYTVDIHSIFVVREIENLLNYKYENDFPLLTKIGESVVKRHVLYISCLLHDVGKGSGKNHSVKGAEIVRRVGSRMGLSREDTEQLEFLVRHHLIMPHFSQRRDIHDPGLVERFAELVKSLETLSLLYLLTFADIRSVGPEVWTSWKSMLLRELYLRTARHLDMGEYTRESMEDRRRNITEKIVKMTEKELPEKDVKSILALMPDSYFLGYSLRAIANHVNLISEFGEKTATDVRYHPGEGYDEFTYWGYDEKGIFSRICGVLSACGLNILGARIITTRNGRVIDDLYVNKNGNSTINEDEIWRRVDEYLKQIEEGRLDIRNVIEKKKRSESAYKKFIPKYPSRVEFDNESSNDFTIIDIYTNDRPGLLYDVTRTLSELDLSINYAKISTKVDQVVDAFYISGPDNRKVLSPKILEKIKNSLLESI